MSETREKDRAEAMRRDEIQIPSDFCDGCAHRDAQVIAFLRERAKWAAQAGHVEGAYTLDGLANRIERGEHVRP